MKILQFSSYTFKSFQLISKVVSIAPNTYLKLLLRQKINNNPYFSFGQISKLVL